MIALQSFIDDAEAFRKANGLQEPHSIRLILHDYMHYKFRIGVSIKDELYLRIFEGLLDGTEPYPEDYPLEQCLLETLPDEFIRLWNEN